MNNKISITNDKERSGRTYVFDFKTEEIKNSIRNFIFKSIYSENLDEVIDDFKKIINKNNFDFKIIKSDDNKIDMIGTIIYNIKEEKDLYNNLEYKILGVDNAVDIIAIMVDKEKNTIKIPIIDRKYAPLGFALPGGFVEKGDSLIETAIKEFREELNHEITNDPIYITKFFEGKDENGVLYDKRGEVTTQGFVFEIPLNSDIKAGSDASKFKYLEFNLNDDLEKVLMELNKLDFAMDRHKEILNESLSNIDYFKEKSIPFDLG